MTYFISILKTALFDFSRNKLRTLLTVLGIFIGIASVILLLALGSGLKVFVRSQFEGLGTNLVFVMPGKVLAQGGAIRPGWGTLGGVRFDEKDVSKIKKIEGVVFAVPYFIKTVRVQSEGESAISDIRGTTEENFQIANSKAYAGKLFTKKDIKKKSKVAVMGFSLAEKLFNEASLAVGKTIRVENQGFKVIGVLEKKGDISHNSDSAIFMPYTTAFVFSVDKKFFDIHIQTENYEKVERMKSEIKAALLKRYNDDDFSVLEQKEIIDTINTILDIIGLIFVAIGAISLIVGGVGIMNIMYVSVTERRKEIGIRRAIGATKKDILLHFLAESVLLALLGGILGVFIAFITVFFVRRVFPAYIDVSSILLALGVASAVGILFGVFPAKKAADLSPIDAIRYE